MEWNAVTQRSTLAVY